MFKVIRIPTKFTRTIKRFSKDDKNKLLDILIDIGNGKEVYVPDSILGDTISLIYGEWMNMESKNGNKPKFSLIKGGNEALPGMSPGIPGARVEESRVEESRVEESRVEYINISKDIEQSSEIVKKDNRVLEIDLIIETLKELNGGIIDDKIKSQRRYGKHIKTKLDKMNGFNGDYVGFIKYIYENSDEYRKQYFRSAEKFYYNIAGIVAGIKTNIKTKTKVVSV